MRRRSRSVAQGLSRSCSIMITIPFPRSPVSLLLLAEFLRSEFLGEVEMLTRDGMMLTGADDDATVSANRINPVG